MFGPALILFYKLAFYLSMSIVLWQNVLDHFYSIKSRQNKSKEASLVSSFLLFSFFLSWYSPLPPAIMPSFLSQNPSSLCVENMALPIFASRGMEAVLWIRIRSDRHQFAGSGSRSVSNYPFQPNVKLNNTFSKNFKILSKIQKIIIILWHLCRWRER